MKVFTNPDEMFDPKEIGPHSSPREAAEFAAQKMFDFFGVQSTRQERDELARALTQHGADWIIERHPAVAQGRS